MFAPGRRYRPLSAQDQARLRAVLAEPFPGRDELLAQLATAKARRIDAHGSLRIAARGTRARVLSAVPVSRPIPGDDGRLVEAQLHVTDGRLHALVVRPTAR